MGTVFKVGDRVVAKVVRDVGLPWGGHKWVTGTVAMVGGYVHVEFDDNPGIAVPCSAENVERVTEDSDVQCG